MTHYRKSKRHDRLFYEIIGMTCTEVVRKQKVTVVRKEETGIMADSVSSDNELYTDCTKEEFENAYNQAMEVLKERRIQ